MSTLNLRNICIIAHVDHGKTTLVDYLLKQADSFQRGLDSSERIMDSMDLERERGITIMAKNTSIRVGDVKINVVDTPGHADFGGEVERIMGMVDGAILLVDAAEGPLPQTRFVLQKAIKHGLRVILVINKVDRPECKDETRITDVVNQTFDLFVDLGATEEQADFPIVYACGRDGWCTTDRNEISSFLEGKKEGNLKPLFDLILSYMPKPRLSDRTDFSMMISNLSYSDYVGQLGIGRIMSGTISKNEKAYRFGLDKMGKPVRQSFQVSALYAFDGLKQQEVNQLVAGDIGVIAGSEGIEIGDTISSKEDAQPLERIEVETPTLAMIFSINTSPLSGQEGDAIQSRKLRERLIKEVRHNVALRLEELETPDQFRVLGRGELQFAILIEQMRREGSEFMIGRPQVLYKTDDSGQKLEPMERAVLDLPEQFSGDVTSMFQARKGILTKYENMHGGNLHGGQRIRLEFDIPTRGLLGIQSRYLTATRGEGLFSSQLIGYAPFKGELAHRNNGALIADRDGETIEYALLNLEERGVLFVKPGIKVYEGMIIGEHAKEDDLNVNPCKEKKLTNVRAANAEVLVTLAGIRQMSLERCIEWIDEDEWIEVTPQSIRIRKKMLNKNQRSVKRSARIE